jgi:hypothetical protein
LLVTACGGEQDEGALQLVGTKESRLTEVPEATAARASRESEVNEYIADWHARAGHVILDTVTQKNGDVVDLVAAASVPGSQIDPPQAPPQATLDPREEVVEQPINEGAGDASVIRYVRPKFSRYVDGSSGANSIADFIRDQVRPGTPCTNNCKRLYAGSQLTKANKGASSYINANWSPGQIDSSTFFLAQTNVVDFNTSTETDAEWIGWIIGRDPLLGNNAARLYTEFFTCRNK